MSDLERLLRLRDVQTLIPFSKGKIYTLIKEMKFPKPHKIGSSSVWKYSDIQNYIKEIS